MGGTLCGVKEGGGGGGWGGRKESTCLPVCFRICRGLGDGREKRGGERVGGCEGGEEKGQEGEVEILDGGGEKKRMRGGRNGRREWRNEGNG